MHSTFVNIDFLCVHSGLICSTLPPMSLLLRHGCRNINNWEMYKNKLGRAIDSHLVYLHHRMALGTSLKSKVQLQLLQDILHDLIYLYHCDLVFE